MYLSLGNHTYTVKLARATGGGAGGTGGGHVEGQRSLLSADC